MNLPKIAKFLFLPLAATLAQSAYAQDAVKAKVGAHAVDPGPAAAGHSRSFAWVMNSPAEVHAPGQTSCTSGCYYEPADLTSAYGISSIAGANEGSGVTVGIVDAYYNPQTEADLKAFSTQWGLPGCTIASGCLTIVTQTGCVIGSTGCTSPGHGSYSWAIETDLDVQTVHGIAPKAHIVLVVCDSTSDADLYAGVVTAYGMTDVVTNSYGGNEFKGETSDESIFSASTVPILFSAGDTGAETEYPCTSAYVVCIGGTSLLTNSIGGNAFRAYEGAWGVEPWSGNAVPAGGGGGCSTHISEPGFQSSFGTTGCGTMRAAPDVSALADEYTAMELYLGSNAAGTYCTGCTAGLYPVGGTSLASPLTAGVIANIDAGRLAASLPILGSNLNALIYQAAAAPYYLYRFFDVTLGYTTDDGSFTFDAEPGYDLATGLGVVLGPSLAYYLLTATLP